VQASSTVNLENSLTTLEIIAFGKTDVAHLKRSISVASCGVFVKRN
jgi:hypothetical protein